VVVVDIACSKDERSCSQPVAERQLCYGADNTNSPGYASCVNRGTGSMPVDFSGVDVPECSLDRHTVVVECRIDISTAGIWSDCRGLIGFAGVDPPDLPDALRNNRIVGQ
jgi:hypothetical protein